MTKFHKEPQNSNTPCSSRSLDFSEHSKSSNMMLLQIVTDRHLTVVGNLFLKIKIPYRRMASKYLGNRKRWVFYADLVVDEFIMAWDKGVAVFDASDESASSATRVFVKCIFATWDYPGNLKHNKEILRNIAKYCEIL